MPKIFPTVIKVCQIEGNLKYEPKESCDNFSLPDLEANANTGAAIAEKLQGDFFGPAVSDMPNTTSEK